MKMHWLNNTVLALAIMAAPVLAVAADISAIRPFTEAGIIDAPLEQGVIVISDVTYHLTDNTTVNNLQGEAVSHSDLQRGAKVGFTMYGTRAQWFISDIWILPNDYNLDAMIDD